MLVHGLAEARREDVVVPEQGDHSAAGGHVIDELPGDGPGFLEAPAPPEQALVHDGQRYLHDVQRLPGSPAEGPEGMAHAVPEAGAVVVAQRRVVAEPGPCQQGPGVGRLEGQVVVAVAAYAR